MGNRGVRLNKCLSFDKSHYAVLDHVFRGHIDNLRAMCWMEEDELLLTGGDELDRTIKIWNLAAGGLIKTIEPHTWAVSDIVECRGTPNCFVSSSWDSTIKVWTKYGELKGELVGHHRDVFCLASCGRKVASGGLDGTIRIWDVDTFQQVAVLERHHSDILALKFKTEKYLISSSNDCRLYIWNLETKNVVRDLHGYQDFILCIQYCEKRDMMATGGSNCHILIWDMKKWKPTQTLTKHKEAIMALDIDQEGNRLVSGADDKMILIWSLHTFECLHMLKGHTENITRIRISQNGRRFISSSRDQTAKTWKIRVTVPEIMFLRHIKKNKVLASLPYSLFRELMIY
mmetsp:Transcript_43813/g.50395  ORF Transcript_43813/g.50395 Transcript_43813/m.50395 type:complete len:344 (+) Transcript_43813:142-1173(+)